MLRFRTPAPWLGLLLLAGCASTPDPIAEAPDGASLAAVRGDPERYEGSEVRWGGTIAGVTNLAELTRVFVVARALGESGRPRSSDRSEGRFIAELAGFQDPAIYAVGREITVLGRVGGAESQQVGGFDYLHPVVRAHTHRLWTRREPEEAYRRYPPYYYDPWYPHPYFWPHPRRW